MFLDLVKIIINKIITVINEVIVLYIKILLKIHNIIQKNIDIFHPILKLILCTILIIEFKNIIKR